MFGDVYLAPNVRQMGETTRMGILELASTLSATFEGEHVHASNNAGRGLTLTERYPLELAASILKAVRCHVRRSEGISIIALGTGTEPHVDETDVYANNEWWRWEAELP